MLSGCSLTRVTKGFPVCHRNEAATCSHKKTRVLARKAIKQHMKSAISPLLVITIAAAVAARLLLAAEQTPASGQPQPSPAFHHLHMNSPNPTAAIDKFMKVFPQSTKVTVGGFEGIRSANGVTMLFTKVASAPPAPGPDKVSAAAPQTAFWHHVWNVD